MGAELVWALECPSKRGVVVVVGGKLLPARLGQRADQKAMRCAIELFQNLTKHAAEVSLKVGYDRHGQCHLRAENDVAPAQWDGLQEALAPVIELDMTALKARRLEQLEHGARTASGGAGLGLMDLRLCSRDNLAAECIPFESGGGKLTLDVVLNPKSD